MTAAEEHRAKCAALVDVLGFDALAALVPVPVERIRAALATGDKHLNTIPLALWDRAALGTQGAPGQKCPTCGGRLPDPRHSNDYPYNVLRQSARREPWSRAPSLSLGDRLCALKHVARCMAQGVRS